MKNICFFVLFLMSVPVFASTSGLSKWQIQEFEQNRVLFEGKVREWVDDGSYDIECSPFHCIARKNKKVWSIGLNNKGQLGLGDTDNRYRWSEVSLVDVGFVSLGFYHTYFVKKNIIYAVGDNRCSQLGQKGTNYSQSFILSFINSKSNIKQISAGGYFGLILLENGDVYGVGCNNKGQISNNDKKHFFYWKKTNLKNIEKIASGGYHAYAFDKDAELFGSGDQTYGQLGFYDPYQKGFMKIHQSDIKDISAGAYHGYILKNNGKLYATGKNDKGQLGYGKVGIYSSRWKKTLENVSYVNSGAFHGHAYVNGKELFAVGYNAFYQLGKSTNSTVESEWILIEK